MTPLEVIKQVIEQHPQEVAQLLLLHAPGAPLSEKVILQLSVHNPHFRSKLQTLIAKSQFDSFLGGKKPKINLDTLNTAINTAGAITQGVKTLKSNAPTSAEPYDVEVKTKTDQDKEDKKILGLKKPIFFGLATVVLLLIIVFIWLKYKG